MRFSPQVRDAWTLAFRTFSTAMTPTIRKKRGELLFKLSNATLKLPSGPTLSDEERDAVAAEAIRCAMIMFMLTASPPFPARMVVKGDTVEFIAPGRIPLRTVDDAKEWAEAALNLVG